MKYRYERKYLVPNHALEPLRARLSPFLTQDTFARKQTDGTYQYSVRSVYLDTHDFNSLHEKQEGVEERKKLRVRGYNQPESDSLIFLEVKRKIGDRSWKTRSKVPLALLEELFTRGFTEKVVKSVDAHNLSEARKFLYNMYRFGYRPVSLVAYEREPFAAVYEPGVRITFDKNVRAKMWPGMKDLFSNSGLRLMWKDHFVLEVKYYDGPMPSWARSIVQEFALRHEALSKFATPFYDKEICISNIKIGA